TVEGTVNVAKNAPERSVFAVAMVDESNVIVMGADGLKFDPETLTVVPTIPDAGLRLIVEMRIVRVACPVRVPTSTSPVTVNVNGPPGVGLDVAIVRAVDDGADALDGNGIGLLRFMVVLVGAPDKESSMLAGSPFVV